MVAAAESFHEDGQYQEMLTYFQRGEWREGLLLLNTLIERYPLEHELRGLRQEMQLRASIDAYEKSDIDAARRQQRRRLFTRALVALAIFAVIFYAIYASAGWLQRQGEQARGVVVEQRRVFDLNNKFQQALQYIAAYRVAEAQTLIDEITQVDPGYPGLAEAARDVEDIAQMEATYQQAMALKAEGKRQETLQILEQIPNYRDARLQINDIRRDFSLSDLVSAGDQAVAIGNWGEAITQYEGVRSQDPLYMRTEVEERLYNSYINAAKAILEEQPDSLEALQQARQYFGKALSVRPQDPKVFEELAIARQTVADRLFAKYIQLAQEALTGQVDSISALRKAEEHLAQAQAIYPNDPAVGLQRRMAQAYITALADFNKTKWDSAIKNLQFIFDQDVDYAGGTARQALYDAYIARGDAFMLNGRAQSALADYQAAVNIAQLRPDSLLRLFEAQARVGNAMGVIGNYQTAVYQYRAALEEANIYASVFLTPELDTALRNAEANALRGRYRNAYNQYRDAMRQVVESLQTITHTVTGEDYLARLANEYQTTVAAILAANKLTDPNQVAVGDKIIIPVLSTP